MKNKLSIGDLLEAAANQMWIDFDKLAQLQHPGEKGRGREDVVRDFLKDYMPGRFGVDTGFVVDVKGNVSGQIDVVIYDRASAPTFKMSETVRIFPVESVAAVLQVKSYLDQRQLYSAIENLRTALTLDRMGSQHPYMMLGGVMHPSEIHVMEGQPDEGFIAGSEPILTGIFAFQGTAIANLAATLKEADAAVPVELRLPLVCVLDQGIISYVSGEVCAPFNAYYSGAWLGYIKSREKGLNLRSFYVMLGWGASRKLPLTPSYRGYVGLQPIEVLPA